MGVAFMILGVAILCFVLAFGVIFLIGKAVESSPAYLEALAEAEAT
jgi:hypothetical protein